MKVYILAYRFGDSSFGSIPKEVKIFSDWKYVVEQANDIHDFIHEFRLFHIEDDENYECSIPNDPDRWKKCGRTDDFFTIVTIELDINSSLISEFRL